MLVVLMIAALLTSLAVLSISDSGKRRLREDGERLSLAFETAADEAHLRDQALQWRVRDGGYAFWGRAQDGWRPLVDPLLAARRFDAEVKGVAIHYAGAFADASHLDFGTESIGVPVTVTLYSSAGTLRIAGNGSGRFEVQP